MRNRHAEDDATAPAAITPLMKFRLDTDSGFLPTSCYRPLLDHLVGPGLRPMERRFVPVDDNPFLPFCSTIFLAVFLAGANGHQMSSLTFLGAAGTVTGLEAPAGGGAGSGFWWIAACFKASRSCGSCNWEPFPFESGRNRRRGPDSRPSGPLRLPPRLVAGGFRGRIYCTPATRDLLHPRPAGLRHLQEEDARDAEPGWLLEAPSGASSLYPRSTRHGRSPSSSWSATTARSRLRDARGTRDERDGRTRGRERDGRGTRGRGRVPSRSSSSTAAPARFVGRPDTRRRHGPPVRRRPGRYGRPVLPDSSPVAEADYLLLESTYGDRLHEAGRQRRASGAHHPGQRLTRGGKVIMPSFAIGRVEEVLYWLKRLEEEKRIPVLPVYVDSPMAIGALQFYAGAAQRARSHA